MSGWATALGARLAAFRARSRQTLLLALGPVLFVLASAYRRVWIGKCEVIVVVGSFGKTTTTALVAKALGCKPAPGSILPSLALRLLRLRRGTDRVVLEVGISRKRQMWALATMLRPDVVVVTSIGSEHEKGLGTLEVTRREKARMVEALRPGGLAVLNGDDANVMWMATRTAARVIRCGFGEQSDVRATGVRIHFPPRMDVRVAAGDGEVTLHTRLVARTAVFSVLAAWAVAREAGVPEDEIARRVERAQAVSRRMKPVPLTNGAWAIVDDQKAVRETVLQALDTLAEAPARRKWVLMGELGGGLSGDAIQARYEEAGERLGEVADRLVLATKDPRKREYLTAAAVRAGMAVEHITGLQRGLDDLTERLREELREGDVLLIKGRFHERLSRVALALEGLSVRCWIPRCDLRGLECRTCPARTGARSLRPAR